MTEKKDPIYGSEADLNPTIPPGGMSAEETAALREKIRNPEESLGQLAERISVKNIELRAAVKESVQGILGEEVEVIDFLFNEENPEILEFRVKIIRGDESEERKFLVKRSE